MASIFISSFSFIVAAFFIKRKLEEWDIPGGMTRAAVIFFLALFVSYVVGFIVDKIVG